MAHGLSGGGARGRQYDASCYEARRFADRRTLARFARLERAFIEHAQGRDVLEVGCGTGRVLRTLPARSVFGVDVNLGMLRVARAAGLPVALGDGNRLPLTGEVFDVVVCADGVLGQLAVPRALAECARVLRPGGVLLVHVRAERVWSVRRPWSLTTVPGVNSEATAERVVQAARRQGLQLERLELFRWLRVSPYWLRVPARPSVPIWNHGLLVLRKRR